MYNFMEWLINESSGTRYSVEINYRTSIDETLKHFAKICLGYASAGLKKDDFHVKQVFDDDMPRILVSARNWDDGTWTVVVSWNPHQKSFYISKGFYRKDMKIVIKQGESVKTDASNGGEVVTKVKNLLHSLRDKPDRHVVKMRGIPLKRGPKS